MKTGWCVHDALKETIPTVSRGRNVEKTTSRLPFKGPAVTGFGNHCLFQNNVKGFLVSGLEYHINHGEVVV
jgi:hypothetical protein